MKRFPSYRTVHSGNGRVWRLPSWWRGRDTQKVVIPSFAKGPLQYIRKSWSQLPSWYSQSKKRMGDEVGFLLSKYKQKDHMIVGNQKLVESLKFTGRLRQVADFTNLILSEVGQERLVDNKNEEKKYDIDTLASYNSILLNPDSYTPQQVTEAFMTSLKLSLEIASDLMDEYEHHNRYVLNKLVQLFKRLNEWVDPYSYLFDSNRRRAGNYDVTRDSDAIQFNFNRPLSLEEAGEIQRQIIESLTVISQDKGQPPVPTTLVEGVWNDFDKFRRDLDRVQYRAQGSTEGIVDQLQEILNRLPDIALYAKVHTKAQERWNEVGNALDDAGYVWRTSFSVQAEAKKLRGYFGKLFDAWREQQRLKVE
ncbi:MAG: hypothetical protein WBQ73_02465 [Candidatus Babeliales bacterium]